MYTSIQLAVKYIQYYLFAENGKGHGVHSPFVYDLISQVLNDDRIFYSFQPIEDCRKTLQNSMTEITFQHFRSEPSIENASIKSVATIASTSLKPKKYGQLLFRLVNYFTPQTIIELNTSLGITSAYMASANFNANLFTLEESTEIASIAAANFEELGLSNTTFITGHFDDTLTKTLENIELINFAFIDGIHQFESSIRYFEQVIQKSDEHTVIIIGDIHCSKEMEAAWIDVKKHQSVTLTIDLFYVGIVFFRKEQKEKQHFVIRY